MKWLVCLAGALLVSASGAPAQTADRLTDEDVKRLIETVNQARDRFEDQLDGKVKNGTLRSATGEMQVTRSLDDLQDAVERLKSRFTSDYSASTEVEALLRRGNAFDGVMKAQPAGLKGANEWERLAGAL